MHCRMKFFAIRGCLMRRFLAILSCAALVAFTGAATHAFSSNWSIAKMSGEVWLKKEGVQTVSLGPNADIVAGSVVATGKNGRALLVRNAETMVVGPQSMVTIPRDGNPQFTTILMRTGTTEFDVEKRNVQHFDVETPFLAAVVKGTHFTVRVGSDGASVGVARGRVQVTALRSGKTVDVLPGQAIKVGSDGSIALSGKGEFSEIVDGEPRDSLVEPLTNGQLRAGLENVLGGVGSLATIGVGSDGVSADVAGGLAGASVGGAGVSASAAGGSVSASVGSGGVSASVGGTGGVSAGVGSGGISVGIGGISVGLGGNH